MTERAVTVQPGRVTPLGDTLPAGTSIFNLDSAHAIWVSNNPGVVPGQGAKVGAYGSILWQGGACYAVPDTGVTAPVNLTLSDQAVSPVNPVDTATAVASQLALQGIPSVLLGSLVYAQNLVGLAGTSFTIPIDVSQYANLTITLSNPGGGYPQAWQVVHYDSKTFSRLYAKQYVQQAISTSGISFDVTPRGDQLVVNWTTVVSPILISVYATNRAMPERIINTDPYFYSVIASQSIAPFANVTFPGMFTTAGGLHNIYVDSSTGTPLGYVIANYLDSAGNAQDIVVCSINKADQAAGPFLESAKQITAVMPAGAYSLKWHAGGTTTNTYQLTLSIVPSGA